MIIFAVVLEVIFIALFAVVNYQNNKKVEGNPYGKSKLDPATIAQLDDELYQNQILPDELAEQVESGEAITVYFYSPSCVHCQRTTPVVKPMAENYGIDLKKLNLLEFQDQWKKYNIKSTPTIIHFENGEEVARIVGEHKQEAFENFFEQEVLGE